MQKYVSRLLGLGSMARVVAAAALAFSVVGCAGMRRGPSGRQPKRPPQTTTTSWGLEIRSTSSYGEIPSCHRSCRCARTVRCLPLVDGLVAQGKTSAQIARDVEKELGKYVRDPVVTVIVTGFVGPYSEQIRVVGEAAKPQFLPYKQK